jgi:hypothetical protein
MPGVLLELPWPLLEADEYPMLWSMMLENDRLFAPHAVEPCTVTGGEPVRLSTQRLEQIEHALRISGWFCFPDTVERSIDPTTLPTTLKRLDIVLISIGRTDW